MTERQAYVPSSPLEKADAMKAAETALKVDQHTSDISKASPHSKTDLKIHLSGTSSKAWARTSPIFVNASRRRTKDGNRSTVRVNVEFISIGRNVE